MYQSVLCFDLGAKFRPSSDYTRIRVGSQPPVKATTDDDNDDDDDGDDDDDEDGDEPETTRRPWGTAGRHPQAQGGESSSKGTLRNARND